MMNYTKRLNIHFSYESISFVSASVCSGHDAIFIFRCLCCYFVFIHMLKSSLAFIIVELVNKVRFTIFLLSLLCITKASAIFQYVCESGLVLDFVFSQVLSNSCK